MATIKMKDIIEAVVDITDLPPPLTKMVIESFIDEIVTQLVQGNNVTIRDFVAFEVKDRPARNGRHPITGEIVTFPPTRGVVCHICQAVKDELNGR